MVTPPRARRGPRAGWRPKVQVQSQGKLKLVRASQVCQSVEEVIFKVTAQWRLSWNPVWKLGGSHLGSRPVEHWRVAILVGYAGIIRVLPVWESDVRRLQTSRRAAWDYTSTTTLQTKRVQERDAVLQSAGPLNHEEIVGRWSSPPSCGEEAGRNSRKRSLLGTIQSGFSTRNPRA